MRSPRALLSLLASGLLLATGVGTAPSASAAVPKAATSVAGTPKQLLAKTPAVAPLRVGYTSGIFPSLASRAKDARGCTLRNQMLIKLAKKKPKVASGCKLVGGSWSVDFGRSTVTSASKVKLGKLAPDVYVFGQGGSSWTPAQRNAYVTVVPISSTSSTRMRPRALSMVDSTSSGSPSPATIVPLTPAGLTFVNRVNTMLIANSEPDQATLDALKASNPTFFTGWTVAMLLNAQAWGISLSPSLFANFGVTLEQCSGQSICNGSYTVTQETSTFRMTAVPQIASSLPAQDSAILSGYGTPTGETIERFLFGIHAPAHWTSDLASGYDGEIDPATIPDIPVGYTRLWDTETTWRDLEPSRGVYDWRKLDKQIQVAQRLNAKVMLVLGQTPAWAGSSPQSMPADINDWKNYVRAVCTHYGPSISSYEIWNEANLQTFWTGTPAQMADLTAAAFGEIRACNPSALVVAANTTSRASGSFGTFFPKYLEELKARNWPADAYSVHSYPTASGGADARIRGIGQFRAALALAGAPFTTVFDTEVNYGLAGLGENKIDISGGNAATLIARTYIDSARYGFGSTFWFVWTAQPDSKFGIQLTKQAAVERQAWTTTYDWLVGSRFQRCSETSLGVTVCQFSKGGGNFSIVWQGDVGSSPISVPSGYLTGLGSRMCGLDGGCTTMSTDASYGIGPSPVRIDGTPLSSGAVTTTPVERPQAITVPCLEGRGSPLWTFSCTDFGTVPIGATAALDVKITNQSRKTHSITVSPLGSLPGVNGTLTMTPANGACGTIRYQESCTVRFTWTPSRAGDLGPVPLRACQTGSILQCYAPAYTQRMRGTAEQPAS